MFREESPRGAEAAGNHRATADHVPMAGRSPSRDRSKAIGFGVTD